MYITNWSSVDNSWSYGPLVPIAECAYPHTLSFRVHTLYTHPVCSYLIQFVSEQVHSGHMFHPLEAMGRLPMLEWITIRLWGTAVRTTIPLCDRCTTCTTRTGMLSMHKLIHNCPWPVMTQMSLVYTPLFDEGVHGILHTYSVTCMIGLLLVVTAYLVYIGYVILYITVREVTLYMLDG